MSFRLTFLSMVLVLSGAPFAFAKVEAVKGKKYQVDRVHGPWMIMVCALQGRDDEGDRKALVAAEELVYELRKKQLPAYIYIQKEETENIDRMGLRKRSGERLSGKTLLKRNGVCVLAGNYDSADDKLAKQTLAWVQSYQPKAISDGLFKATPGRSGPLSRAFLTLNPMLSSDEVAAKMKKKDPLLRQLNSGVEYNLSDNPGKYSVQVATFGGLSKQLTGQGLIPDEKKISAFDSLLSSNSSLDESGKKANDLCKLLRNKGIESYVFHDRYRSIVTVGSFDSKSDPKVARIGQQFRAKIKKNQSTGQEEYLPESVQLTDRRGTAPRIFVFDPDPILIDVPKLR